MWRHSHQARGWTVLGSFCCLLIGPDRGNEPVRAAEPQADSVKVLEAERLGLLTASVRGTHRYEVQVDLENRSSKPLRVILPPGLVAANIVGQGGGGCSYQDMGLGSPTNRGGGFGHFGGGSHSEGFRSIPEVDPATGAVNVPVGRLVTLAIPAVCLNINVPAPTPTSQLKLMDINDHSGDPRVRKSLRALATIGTSMGVAQAVMWHVCNGTTFEQMIARGGSEINPREMVLAARFLRALDSNSKLTGFDAGRVFITIAAEPMTSQLVAHLSHELKEMHILGVPVEVVAKGKVPRGRAPMLQLDVKLAGGDETVSTGKVTMQAGEGMDTVVWSKLGQAQFKEQVSLKRLSAAELARVVDRAVASTLVVARPENPLSRWEIHNRLPFSLTNMTIRTGASPSARLVDVPGLGIGPGRTARTVLPAPDGSIDRLELNGL